MASSNRSQITVESNVLMRRAAWCGVVFALAMVLSILNFMPPIGVQYHVHSKVVVSETRLAQLRDLAIADRGAIKRGEKKRIQLMSVKVLDLAEQEQSADSEPTDEKVVLIEVGTLWSSRCTPERHFTWLSNISRIDPRQLVDVQAASQARSARWELEVAQHYKAQFDYFGGKTSFADETTQGLPSHPLADSPQSNVGNATGTQSNKSATSIRPTFQLASYIESPKSAAVNEQTTSDQAVLKNQSAESESAEDFKLQLDRRITLATEQVKQTEVAWQDAVDRSSGVLQIAGLPVISPRSTSIPFWMAASILVLGLAAGSTAGWFQHRTYSGGTYHALQVAEQLSLDSVPIAGRLVLAKSEHQNAISGSGPTAVARTGRGLTRLAEFALTFWVVVAVARFLLDSVWRDVLINSPLAALGRMLAGMP